MASVLRNNLPRISYLEQTLFVDCKFGNVSIDRLQDGGYYVEHPHNVSVRKHFKVHQVEQLIFFLGRVSHIMLLDHDLDEEVWLC
jgi:hypothetical protein